MKKAVCGLMACVLLLGACVGCGQKEMKKEFSFPAALTTQTLLDSGAFSERLEELDPDIAVMLFCLNGDVSEYEGSKVYYSTGATAEIAAVISVRDESKVPEVEEALKAWVNSQIEAEKDYRPAEVPKLENAIVESRGFTVLLVVAADAAKATEAIETIVAEK